MKDCLYRLLLVLLFPIGLVLVFIGICVFTIIGGIIVIIEPFYWIITGKSFLDNVVLKKLGI